MKTEPSKAILTSNLSLLKESDFWKIFISQIDLLKMKLYKLDINLDNYNENQPLDNFLMDCVINNLKDHLKKVPNLSEKQIKISLNWWTTFLILTSFEKNVARIIHINGNLKREKSRDLFYSFLMDAIDLLPSTNTLIIYHVTLENFNEIKAKRPALLQRISRIVFESNTSYNIKYEISEQFIWESKITNNTEIYTHFELGESSFPGIYSDNIKNIPINIYWEITTFKNELIKKYLLNAFEAYKEKLKLDDGDTIPIQEFRSYIQKTLISIHDTEIDDSEKENISILSYLLLPNPVSIGFATINKESAFQKIILERKIPQYIQSSGENSFEKIDLMDNYKRQRLHKNIKRDLSENYKILKYGMLSLGRDPFNIEVKAITYDIELSAAIKFWVLINNKLREYQYGNNIISEEPILENLFSNVEYIDIDFDALVDFHISAIPISVSLETSWLHAQFPYVWDEMITMKETPCMEKILTLYQELKDSKEANFGILCADYGFGKSAALTAIDKLERVNTNKVILYANLRRALSHTDDELYDLDKSNSLRLNLLEGLFTELSKNYQLRYPFRVNTESVNEFKIQDDKIKISSLMEMYIYHLLNDFLKLYEDKDDKFEIIILIDEIDEIHQRLISNDISETMADAELRKFLSSFAKLPSLLTETIRNLNVEIIGVASLKTLLLIQNTPEFNLSNIVITSPRSLDPSIMEVDESWVKSILESVNSDIEWHDIDIFHYFVRGNPRALIRYLRNIISTKVYSQRSNEKISLLTSMLKIYEEDAKIFVFDEIVELYSIFENDINYAEDEPSIDEISNVESREETLGRKDTYKFSIGMNIFRYIILFKIESVWKNKNITDHFDNIKTNLKTIIGDQINNFENKEYVSKLIFDYFENNIKAQSTRNNLLRSLGDPRLLVEGLK